MDRQSEITAQTRLLGLLGHPVEHSFSPVFQNAALRYFHLPMVYVAFDVLPDNLSFAIMSIRSLGILGFNVTVPHKERILPFLDQQEGPARILKAVNTVVNEHGRLTGYNTDVIGFTATLEKHQVNLDQKHCVVLGAGGAAKAVLYVLFQKKVKHITLVNRTPNRLFPVKEWFQKSFRAHLDIENWENFQNGSSDFIDSADIIINTTSLGLRGEEVSLPWGNLRKCEWVIDVVYHPGGTPLVNEAQRCGIPAFDGKTMLLYQGAESFFLFTGQKAPVSVMEEAMNQAITLKIP